MANIFLIGYMGAGKTTVGKRLARRLGWSFVDMDRFIENRYRKKISELFAERGEGVFREMERRVLEEVSAFERTVVATGGGAPCFFDNMERMKGAGITVYLQVSAPELARRLARGRQRRPLVDGKRAEELERFVTEGLAGREMWYGRASVVFPAEGVWTSQRMEALVEALPVRGDEWLRKGGGDE